ncbi:hypothetical protein [Achromobacter spanius]|uniref:DUF1425 domain-containing protein n=1 Tax=Achromobacter spanius TaxID=217203 RepID=A0AAW3HXK6_9BURK|nr:hypothetical protein [Achromobacter spanius]KNE24449.1 hypothetical protein AFM18_25165 [Achromobacter spanius]MCW3152475.1 hypothetical protein [Achromobacter spanius]
MKYRYSVCASALLMGLAGVSAAQAPSRVVMCDMTLAPESALQVQDDASREGAVVEGVTLIDLPNGMKAVQFSIRNARDPKPFGTILRVRYTVQWFDDCGRRIANGAQVLDGLALDPQRQELIQSTAMAPQATRAFVRIYVEN